MALRSYPKQFFTKIDRLLSKSKLFGINENFVRFGIVGIAGFCWDTATVYALRIWLNLYMAGTAGFVVAASANWALNRIWTFRGRYHGPLRQQWLKFMATNTIGFLFNRGTFFILISQNEFIHDRPILGIMAGSLTGLSFNYFLSKRFVFR